MSVLFPANCKVSTDYTDNCNNIKQQEHKSGFKEVFSTVLCFQGTKVLPSLNVPSAKLTMEKKTKTKSKQKNVYHMHYSMHKAHKRTGKNQ